MKISAIRSVLYAVAKALGDVQAIGKARKTKSAKPIAQRVGRRAAGKLFGKLF